MYGKQVELYEAFMKIIINVNTVLISISHLTGATIYYINIEKIVLLVDNQWSVCHLLFPKSTSSLGETC